MDIRLGLMCGIDLPIPECQLVIHQPKIKEIALIGEQDFFTGIQTICINKKMLIQDKALLEETSNFQIFMTIMTEKETAEKKLAVNQAIQLLFPKYKVIFTPRSIMFSGEGSTVMVDGSNFEFLQDMISQVCCLNSSSAESQNFNPANDKAAEIAKKLMRGRQIVAEQKGENNSSIFSQYVSTLAIGINSMTLQDLMDLTIFQIYDLLERYRLYVSWDLDIKQRLAGAKPESQPDNWMKNIH